MPWRHLLYDLVRFQSNESVAGRVLKRVTCASFQDTGLQLVWDLAVDHKDWCELVTVVDACECRVPDYVVNFLSTAVETHPCEAWKVAFGNLHVLNSIPDVSNKLTSFLNLPTTTPAMKYTLFVTFCLGLPADKMVFAPNLFNTLLQFTIDMHACSDVEEVTCLYCINNLFLAAHDLYLPYHDSSLFRVFDVLIKVNDPASVRQVPAILEAFLNIRRSCIVGLDLTVLQHVYKLLLEARYAIPEATIKRVEELDVEFDNMPYETLVKRVKERLPGYTNALAVLSLAASYHVYWAVEITGVLTPSDVMAMQMDNVLSNFVASFGHLIANLVGTCASRYLESNDHASITVLQHLSYKHVDVQEVYEKCIDNHDYDGIVMLVGKVVRVFDDSASSVHTRKTYRNLLSRLTKKACTFRVIDTLQVVLRGLRMITTCARIHQQCFDSILLMLRAFPMHGQELGGCLRHYATGHPDKFLNLLVKPLESVHNAEALVWLYPRFPTRTAVATEIESRIVTELMLHFRQSQHPGLLSKLLEYTAMHDYELPQVTKASIFRMLLESVVPMIRKMVTRRVQCLSLHMSVLMKVLVRMTPPVKYLGAQLVEHVSQEALACCGWLPRTAATLLWTIRERSPLWAHPFLCSILDRDELHPFHFGGAETVVETYIWTCYRQGEDPIFNTFGNLHERTRVASKTVLRQLPAPVVAFVKEHMYQHIVRQTIPHRYVYRVYSRMCKAIPQRLFVQLQQHATTVPEEHQADVLRLLYDLLVNVPRAVTSAYAECLSLWSSNLLRREDLDAESQMLLIDVLVYCIEYLYKSDCKRRETLAASFERACKQVKRSHSTRTQGQVQDQSTSRLDGLLPEIQKHIIDFISLTPNMKASY